MPAPSPKLDAEPTRFALSIGGKIYGPYTAQQMRGYIAEGRVTALSLVSRDGGAWTPAAEDSFCAPALAQRAVAAPQAAPTPPSGPVNVDAPEPDAASDRPTRSSAAAREAFLKELEGIRAIAPSEPAPRTPGPPRPEEPSPAPLFPTERETAAEPSNFLIVFDLKSRGPNKLEEHIMSLGRAVRLLPGVWAVSTLATAGMLRNQLTKFFGTTDAFVIIDASRDKLAWFNLGPETDSQIRQVWRRG